MAATSINIDSLSGGLNEFDSPLSLRNDECTVAENVEFYRSPLGERRLGCSAIGLPTSITSDAGIEAVSWMGVHYPTNTLGDKELWVLGQTIAANYSVLTRRTTSNWNTVTVDDAMTVASGYGHRLNSVSLHGKHFIAYKSSAGIDQLHVYVDGNLRKTSLAAPTAAPTAADVGGAGYATIRYFRVRYVKLSGTTVLLRSEPSTVLSWTPTAAASATITRPPLISQGETHWELEASTDNANFYRIARTLVATTTYNDSTVYAVGYSSGTLSESLTQYTQLPSGKFLGVDADRLLIAGSWENAAYASRLWWTPVLGNTGVGNDERLDMTTNPFIDLNGYVGGEITGLSKSINSYFFVFKWSHIYKINRSGQRSSAYEASPVSTARGAIPGSLVEAVDQSGNPAIYFTDPTIGPMRLGINGLEWCGADVQDSWARLNRAALVPVHGVFYQTKNQVHYWLAVDGSDYPNYKIVVHCNEMRSTIMGGRRGWVTVPVGNRISAAHCSILFSNNVDSTSARNPTIVPFIGKASWTVSGVVIKDLVQQCDVGVSDALTTGDTLAYYYATVTTKPFTPTTLLGRSGVMGGTIVAESTPGAANGLYINVVADFGLEQHRIPISLIPTVFSEDMVIKQLDNLNLSEATTVQFELGDLDPLSTPTTPWKLFRLDIKLRPEQTI